MNAIKSILSPDFKNTKQICTGKEQTERNRLSYNWFLHEYSLKLMNANNNHVVRLHVSADVESLSRQTLRICITFPAILMGV